MQGRCGYRLPYNSDAATERRGYSSFDFVDLFKPIVRQPQFRQASRNGLARFFHTFEKPDVLLERTALDRRFLYFPVCFVLGHEDAMALVNVDLEVHKTAPFFFPPKNCFHVT